MTPLAMGLCALSGCTTGLAAAVVWLLLNLPSRVMDVFAFHGPRRCGWALALGMALGAFAPMAGVSAPLGQAAGAAALLLGGAMIFSVSVQALAAEWLVKHRGSLENRLYDIPAEIDDAIGRAKLAALGLSIDRLTQEQEEYLHSAL